MPGRIAEGSTVVDVISRRAEGIVAFGVALETGTLPEETVRAYTGSARIIGVSLFDPTKGYGPARGVALTRQYDNNQPVAILRKGIITMIAGATSGTIVAGTRLTLLKSLTVFPTLQVTGADSATGTQPNWGSTTRVAYTVVGEWGETALIGISGTINCVAIANEVIITVPGQTGVPAGTSHVRIYVSTDNGTTWRNWPTGNIAFASLTVGATHVINANAANQVLGTTSPPAANPTLPAIGAVVKSTDTRDVLAVTGSEIIKGGTAGQEIWVELNLPV